jgi:hypothetical protein
MRAHKTDDLANAWPIIANSETDVGPEIICGILTQGLLKSHLTAV